jgi:hypothetical protein
MEYYGVYCMVDLNGRFTRYYQYVMRASGAMRRDDYATKTDMAFSRACECGAADKHPDAAPT